MQGLKGPKVHTHTEIETNRQIKAWGEIYHEEFIVTGV